MHIYQVLYSNIAKKLFSCQYYGDGLRRELSPTVIIAHVQEQLDLRYNRLLSYFIAVALRCWRDCIYAMCLCFIDLANIACIIF